MKFRKKHKAESEVFTDSLNDILFILLMFFLIVATLANPNIVRVGLPRGTKDTKAKQNIMVSIDKNQQFYIGSTRIERGMIDSFLTREIKGKGNGGYSYGGDQCRYFGLLWRSISHHALIKEIRSKGSRKCKVGSDQSIGFDHSFFSPAYLFLIVVV